MWVRGIDLAVSQNGEGPPLFWGHGLLGSTTQEDEAELLDWEEIGREGRVLRYDARGHGRSEATLDARDYRWTELARDLWALCDACEAGSAVLGGFSMGCATALHAATARPERVAGLVLAAPPTAWDTRPRQARLYRTLAALIGCVGVGPFSTVAGLAAWAPGPPHLKRVARSVAHDLRRADRRAVVAALRGAAASDLPAPESLRAVAAPALVLAWEGDPAHPLSTAERLGELLPHAELRVARSEDDVHGWSASISAFLGSLPSRDP